MDTKRTEEGKDPTFIKAIRNMLQYRKNVSAERIGIEQYNMEIDEAIAQIEDGKIYTYQQTGERIKQWGKQ